MRLTRSGIATGVLGVLLAGMPAAAQDAGTRPATRPAERQGLFGGGGPGMFGGGVRQERKLLAQFDKDKNGWLNNEERKAAREFVKNSGGPRRGPGGFGRRGNQEPPKPGPKVTPEEVRSYDKDAPLYEPSVLRTLFLEFENADWEAEVADFKGSDVEVPATLTVDGKRYPNVGVHFRGASSYGAAGPGYKKSINLTMDLVDSKQKLYGYKTLNLLNSNGDPTMLRAAVYSHIASKHLPVAKVNLVKVVINGEYWGVYANSQQVNKEFFKEHKEKFGGSSKGIRWKVPGSPQGKGSLSYLGDSPEPYKAIYAIKTEDKEEQERGWKALIHLCKMLKETPPEQVEEKISPLLNIEGALWFLAIENALINSDGYWIRNSDYHLFLDEKGKFHVIPHDINEALAPGGGGPGGGMRRGPAPGPQGGGPGGPPGADGPRRGPGPEGEPRRDVLRPEGEGRGDGPRPEGEARPLPPPDGFRERGQGGPPVGGPRGGGVGLDPMTGAQDASKPLLSKLLASPKLKEKYLRNIRTIAAEDLDWEKLGPVVQRYVELIEKDVEADTRKLDTFEAFKQGVSEEAPAAGAPGRRMSLKQFAEQRRKFLLEHPAIKALPE